MARVVIALLLGIWLAVGFTSPLPAVITNWNTDSSGNFNAAANWDNGAPGSADTAVFRRGSGITYNVTFPGDLFIQPIPNYITDRLRVGSNTVSFIMSTAPHLGPATYQVVNSDISAADRGIVIGELPGDTAVLNTRLLSFSGVAATIGSTAGSQGTATVEGAGSTWTNSFELVVGYADSGTLNITDGGLVTNGIGYIGKSAGSNGSVTVSGGTWNNGDELHVAEQGMATMTINSSGSVSNNRGLIANDPDAVGGVTVSGMGSVWTSTRIDVGFLGSGELQILDGGRVSNNRSFIGTSPGSVGNVAVIGDGSNWTSADDLIIGSEGNGDLSVQDGGAVTSPNGIIGAAANSSGSATASGPGSNWTIAGDLTVGDSGHGELNINSGGEVSSEIGVIGAKMGSSGIVNVKGAGSTWTVGEFLTVASIGTATLNIRDGGTVTTDGMTMNPGGQLNLLADGFLDVTGTLKLGNGLFNFEAGRLHVDEFRGDLVNQGGTLAPGHSTGVTKITVDYTQQAGAALEIEIGGPTPGTDFDQLVVSGTAALAGILDVSLVSGFMPAVGQQFTVVTAGSVVNNGLILAGSAAGSFALLVDSASVVLKAIAPGDFNGDGSVDAADYVVWRNGLDTTYNQDHYDVWRAHFGESVGIGSNASRAVPEPASVCLLLAAAASFVRRKGCYQTA